MMCFLTFEYLLVVHLHRPTRVFIVEDSHAAASDPFAAVRGLLLRLRSGHKVVLGAARRAKTGL
jgi:hypothetical protein